MTYESPKQIRNRQNAANDKATRRRAQRQWEQRVLTDEEWAMTCFAHIAFLRACEKYPDSAGRHARFLVTAAVERRAFQIMRDFGRARWKAMNMARHELLGKEPI